MDLFPPPDGSCGFEVFRRDVADRGVGAPVGFFSGQRYDDRAAALAAARLMVNWLGASEHYAPCRAHFVLYNLLKLEQYPF